MATNLERLTIKDTFTDWRDKLNALIDVAVLAPMADEDGIMYIDVEHCNAREVRINVPVQLTDEAFAHELHTDGSFVSSITATTIPETVDAGLVLVGTEGYFPWVSGPTRNGFTSIWTSSFDNLLHFSHISSDGQIVNTFTWNPDTNSVSVLIDDAAHSMTSDVAKAFEVEDKTGTTIPGSYPIIFGDIDGDVATGKWSNDLTYDPRSKVLTAATFKGNLNGNAKTATSAGKLSAKQKITLSRDAEGSVQFDGSADATLPCVLTTTGVVPNLYGPADNVNVPRTNRTFTVPSFRVDSKGRILEAYTRTVEFPYPEIDIETSFNTSSTNPLANKTITKRFNDIDDTLANVATKDVATTSKNGLMSASDKTKLNSLAQLPRISSVEIQNYDASTGLVLSTNTKTLSTAKTTKLIVNAKNGMSGSLAIADTTSTSELSLNLSLQLSGIAGSGLAVSGGKLSVPVYTGATASAAGKIGLVPAASSNQRTLFLNGAGEWVNPIGTTYSTATTTTNGLMSAADKSKLDRIQPEATKVSVSRSVTSGVKIATITINGTGTDIYAEKNTDTTYISFTGATASAAGKIGLVPAPAKGKQASFLRGDATWQACYDATQIDNKLALKANVKSPALTDTPTAPTAAVGTNTTQIATTAFVTRAVNNVVGTNCPDTLNTLKKIAGAIGNDADFKGTVDAGLASKLPIDSNGYVKSLAISGKTITVTKGDGTTSTLSTQDEDTKYGVFVKSGSSAASGLVPAPSTTAGSDKYLCENGTWSIPPLSSDEKVKNTPNATVKAYITGTTSLSANIGGQVFDTGVFLTTTAGTLQATTFVGALNGNANTATKLKTPITINDVPFDGTKDILIEDPNKVPVAGGTMTGNLVIKKSAPSETFQNMDVSKGTDPTSPKYWSIPFVDGNGTQIANRLGLIETSISNSGTITTSIRAYKNTNGSTANAALAIVYESGGSYYATAPTPGSSDNSTKVATTAFVKAQGYITGSADISGNAATATKLKNQRKINGVAFDGTKDITIYDSTKVAKTGDTMTGSLTLKGANLNLSVLDSTEGSTTYRSNAVITGNSSNTTAGINVMFGANSNTIVGAGEGKGSLLAELAGNANENVYVIADGGIIFNTNANTYANKKTITLGADGKLTGLVGVTATTFTGSLSGNADSATKLATPRKINGVLFDGTKDIIIEDDTKVAKAGDTMDGNLIIAKASPVLCTRSTGITRGVAPSSPVNVVEILGQDSEKRSTWGIYHQYGADRSNLARLICYNGLTTDTTWSGIGVGYDKNGNAYTIAPTPAIDSNTTHIATTHWVRTASGNTSLNAATASKLGTSTVGDIATPIYLNNGSPAACSKTVGSGTKPVYMNAGTITACNGNVGGIANPVYMNAGTITACSKTVGGTANPVYMSSGTIAACSDTVGGIANPVYMNAGTITACSKTAGGIAKPVYMDAGSIVACSGTVGTATKPVYMNAGTITASTANVGNATTPMYLQNGTMTACSMDLTSINAVPSANVEQRGNNTTYTATTNGYVIFQAWDGGHCGKSYLNVNGMSFELRDSSYGKGSCGFNIYMTCPVKKGWQYSSYSTQGGCILWWLPC